MICCINNYFFKVIESTQILSKIVTLPNLFRNFVKITNYSLFVVEKQITSSQSCSTRALSSQRRSSPVCHDFLEAGGGLLLTLCLQLVQYSLNASVSYSRYRQQAFINVVECQIAFSYIIF